MTKLGEKKINQLHLLDKTLRRFLSAFVIVLTAGVIVGLIYLNQTTGMSAGGAKERFRGSEIKTEDSFEIPESYPKPLSELLVTTHNHVISFSLIFLALGFIFYHNSTINGRWKSFLLIEPFVSTVVSFGSIWGIRYIHGGFVYLTILSAVLIYTSFFLMSAIILYELNFKGK